MNRHYLLLFILSFWMKGLAQHTVAPPGRTSDGELFALIAASGGAVRFLHQQFFSGDTMGFAALQGKPGKYVYARDPLLSIQFDAEKMLKVQYRDSTLLVSFKKEKQHLLVTLNFDMRGKVDIHFDENNEMIKIVHTFEGNKYTLNPQTMKMQYHLRREKKKEVTVQPEILENYLKMIQLYNWLEYPVKI